MKQKNRNNNYFENSDAFSSKTKNQHLTSFKTTKVIQRNRNDKAQQDKNYINS